MAMYFVAVLVCKAAIKCSLEGQAAEHCRGSLHRDHHRHSHFQQSGGANPQIIVPLCRLIFGNVSTRLWGLQYWKNLVR